MNNKIKQALPPFGLYTIFDMYKKGEYRAYHSGGHAICTNIKFVSYLFLYSYKEYHIISYISRGITDYFLYFFRKKPFLSH